MATRDASHSDVRFEIIFLESAFYKVLNHIPQLEFFDLQISINLPNVFDDASFHFERGNGIKLIYRLL